MDPKHTNKGTPETTEPTTLREAHENTLEARDEEETRTPVDPKKTGNKPRFDRDR